MPRYGPYLAAWAPAASHVVGPRNAECEKSRHSVLRTLEAPSLPLAYAVRLLLRPLPTTPKSNDRHTKPHAPSVGTGAGAACAEMVIV